MDDPEPQELLPVSEEDETDDDVAGNDVQIPEELGQDPGNVRERTLKGKKERFFVCFFLRGSVIPFPKGICYRQVAILLQLLGITVIISPPYY
jgi:hypothetical protein